MRGVGIAPRAAHEMVQRMQMPFASEHTHPLPAPTGSPPFRARAVDLGVKDGPALVVNVVSDTGGIGDPNPQKAVAAAMVAAPTPAFVWHNGDVFYYNGDSLQIVPQFLEPYAKLLAPFLGIPGNHDGDVLSGPELAAWMAVFCAKGQMPAGWEEFGRDTQTQPNCYWTLCSEAVTIIGMYTNVPSGGVVSPAQWYWLQGELRAAPADRPLIVATHHPPYSADDHHGGSATIGKGLDLAFANANRYPHMVMSGHVHAYERFTRRTLAGREITYIVCGNSGYHHLHSMALGAKVGEELAPGVVLEAFEDKRWGYLELAIDRGGIGGRFHPAQLGHAVSTDTFRISL